MVLTAQKLVYVRMRLYVTTHLVNVSVHLDGTGLTALKNVQLEGKLTVK